MSTNKIYFLKVGCTFSLQNMKILGFSIHFWEVREFFSKLKEFRIVVKVNSEMYNEAKI